MSGESELDRAIEVFVRGFAVTKSFTHPYVPERVGPAWVMRDGPRRDPRKYRREEWTATAVDPADLHRLATGHSRSRFALCPVRAMVDDQQELRRAYKALGYRFGGVEAMMVHRLRGIPRPRPPGEIAVVQVTTPELADRLHAATRRRQLLPEHLGPGSPLRQYAALDGDAVVGWVQSITVRRETPEGGSEDLTWCSNMYVLPEHRRRGIARALMSRMLADDRRHGAVAAVLLASTVGAHLYPVVGYDQIGELLIFTPPHAQPVESAAGGPA